jgi:hypothetical protein
MDSFIEEAFRVAIQIEKNSYNLYRSAAGMIPEGSEKQLFERLATEEAKLLEQMIQSAPDALADIMQNRDDQRLSCFDGNSIQSPEHRLFNHLRMALRNKHACLDLYTTFVKTFRDPAICRVFELALGVSRKLYGIIAHEYRQADLRLHKPGVTRRVKRTHIRSAGQPIPNKHSQLFISLQDSGRPSPFQR